LVARCYPYRCDCEHEFDVYKPMENIDDLEVCPKCNTELTKSNRMIVGGTFYGEKVEESAYCPALGTVVKNSKHRATIAKERNLVEIGNEDPNKMHTSFEKQREDKKQKTYDDYFSNSIEVQGSK